MTTLRIALPQLYPAWLDRSRGLDQVIETIRSAAKENAELIVFSEGFVPGYPFWLDQSGGANFDNPVQKEIFAHYSNQAVTIEDGHLESVCAALKEAKMACYLGIIERPRDITGHSLFASFVYIDSSGTIQSVHRKLGDFTVGGLNCWENWMPLVRASLYGQGEDLHVACWPGSERNTADLTPVLAKEGRSYCVSVSALMNRDQISDDIPHADHIRNTINWRKLYRRARW